MYLLSATDKRFEAQVFWRFFADFVVCCLLALEMKAASAAGLDLQFCTCYYYKNMFLF